MKRVIPLVIVGTCLIGLMLVWNALEAGAVTPGSPLVVQPTNTPPAPGEGLRSTIYEALPPSGVESMPEQAQPGGRSPTSRFRMMPRFSGCYSTPRPCTRRVCVSRC